MNASNVLDILINAEKALITATDNLRNGCLTKDFPVLAKTVKTAHKVLEVARQNWINSLGE